MFFSDYNSQQFSLKLAGVIGVSSNPLFKAAGHALQSSNTFRFHRGRESLRLIARMSGLYLLKQPACLGEC